MWKSEGGGSGERTGGVEGGSDGWTPRGAVRPWEATAPTPPIDPNGFMRLPHV